MAGSESRRPAVTFRYEGRFGHFLRAEASVSALSYPIPPRTALLGLIGAVLGMPKDTPQTELGESLISVSGPLPKTHWHRVKFRKDPPAPLPKKVKAGAKGSSTDERATLIKQQWLIDPAYTITACLPEEHHEDLASRLKDRRWHYSPCMGLSEMLADLEFVSEGEAQRLPPGSEVLCSSVARAEAAEPDGRRTLEVSQGGALLAVLPLRMPRSVTEERVFTHEDYLLERSGRPMPLKTDESWRIVTEEEDRTVVFL